MAGRRLFVLSDLHLGGRPTGTGERPVFQICHAYDELVDFVDWAAKQGLADEQVELVVNGDIVDFLAEDDFGVDPDGHAIVASEWTSSDLHAVRKFQKVLDRTREGRRAPRGFFDALADFLRAGHNVTFLLGNHDVELALPVVRAELEATLGHSARVRFVHDGEAYVVGRVLIEHGNRYDAWNLLNYDQLRQERSLRSRRLAAALRFKPPSGSYLVSYVMNPMKRRYRFIDLLKPETGAVLPLLLALEPQLDLSLSMLLQIVPIFRHRARQHHDEQGHPIREGELSAGVGGAVVVEHEGGVDADEGVGQVRDLDAILAEVLGREARSFAGRRQRDGELSNSRLLPRLRASVDNLLRSAEAGAALLALWTANDDETRRGRLRVALQAAAKDDRSFDWDVLVSTQGPHESYVIAASTLCMNGGFDVIVFGHTHLPRKLDLTPLVGRHCWYLNTGTWADVIRLQDLLDETQGSSASKDDMQALLGALATNQLEAYRRRYLTYAEILVAEDGTPTEVELRSYCGVGRERELPLQDHGTAV